MAFIFNIPTNPYDDPIRLYERKTLTIKEGLTVLVGCNGSGKSTLMRLIKDKLRNQKDVLCLGYDDRSDGQSNLMSKFGFYDDLNNLSRMLMSSEGERIHIGIEEFVAGLRSKIQRASPKSVFILMDAVGSGLSIDGIDEIKEIVPIIAEDNPNREVYFIVSTNEYEFAEKADCIDVRTFQHLRFGTYEEYKEFILDSWKKKDRRYGRINQKRASQK